MSLLDSLPRVPLGRWPTPLKKLDRASRDLGVEIVAKLENQSGAWGATKVRKLEYLLVGPERRNERRLSAAGAGASTWAAAVALHGYRRGFDTSIWLAGPPPADLFSLYDSCGTDLHVLPGLVSAPLAAGLARLSPGNLPPGGSGGIGDAGTVWLGIEIAREVEGGQIERPEAVFVACGTAGTAAGIAIGLGTRGLDVPVVAARVTPRPLGTASLVARRIRGLQALLEIHEPAAPVVSEDVVGPGYGKAGPDAAEAIERGRRDGLNLDPAYGAKAFAALLDRAREGPGRGPLLLVVTSPGPAPGA